MHAKLIPSYYLDRVAKTRTIRDGEPLQELAEQLRAPLVAPGGILNALSAEAQDRLHDEAKRLRSHQLRGLDRPRKRACFTAIHNFFLTRPNGTTAAERFFAQKPRAMFAAILDAVELAPAPLSPPRNA